MVERAYREERDANTRVRILLALRVRFEKIIPAEASRELHRSRAWATKWLRAYPKSPAARNVIHAHARCSMAR